MGKDSPSQVDPSKLIAQQAGANQINTFTPFGNIRYVDFSRDLPGTGKVERLPTRMELELSPAQQRILNQSQTAQQLLGGAGINLAGQFPNRPMGQFDPSIRETMARFSPSFTGPQAAFQPSIRETAARFSPGNFDAARLAAEQGMFNRGMSLLRPEQQLAEERTLQRLANQGLPQSGAAYNAELSRLERSQGVERARLADAAVLQGLAAQAQGFGQSATSYGLEQARRQQQLGADLAGYQAEAARRQQAFGQDLGAYQAEAQRRQQQFGQDIGAFQANQAQRAGQLQEILGLFGLQDIQLPQQLQSPQIDIPMQAPQQGSAGVLPGLLGLGGAALGAWGGGLPGAQFGFQAGAALPGLFGY